MWDPSCPQSSRIPTFPPKNSLIVHPGGVRTLLAIVLNHWTGRKQQSNHITVSLGKKGQLSTGNLLWLIPARPLLFFSSAESTFHSGFGGTQAFNRSRISASRLSSCIPLESTANSEKPPHHRLFVSHSCNFILVPSLPHLLYSTDPHFLCPYDCRHDCRYCK